MAKAAAIKDSILSLVTDRDKKDMIYRLTWTVTNLHAVQGRNDGETILTHKSIDETKDATFTEGLQTGETTVPQARRRGRQQNTTKSVQTYRFERNSKPGAILVQLGGPYGLFSKALRDAVVSKQREKYWMASLSLIRFECVKGLNTDYAEVVTQTTKSARPGIVLPVDARTAEIQDARMEPRNKQGGSRTMVPVFHERIVDDAPLTVIVDMIVNSECPRSNAEVAGLLHAMEAVPFGPARRGVLKIIAADRVQ